MTVPGEVMAAWQLEGDRIERIPGGLINESYLVAGADGQPRAVLQRLHPIFSGEVNRDIDAITAHLAARGMDTPRVVRTRWGGLWHDAAGAAWRALTYVPGETIHQVDSPDRARAAGDLVGRFHRAVADLRHEFVFTRAGVHDTAGFLVRLGERAASAPADTVGADAVGLARDILIAAAELPELGDLPSRICHGDLKISNVVFRGPDAICLIDLDTLGMQSIAYEMGDALRSWCNPLGEDVAEAAVQRALLDAALDGYLGPAGSLLSQAEIDSIIPGMRMVCIELAARFCLDVFEDRYFGWDATRFASRREHNLVRARGQLSLGLSVAG